MARILVVDDDPDIRFVARLALKRGAHEVTAAESGAVALAHLDSGAPCDLVLCDWMMPEMSGMQTLAEVRRRRSDLPFVFLTARAQKEEIDEGLRMGARRYLTKPFEPAELLGEVNRILAG
jgi:CheY-like chemotaxis protein